MTKSATTHHSPQDQLRHTTTATPDLPDPAQSQSPQHTAHLSHAVQTAVNYLRWRLRKTATSVLTALLNTLPGQRHRTRILPNVRYPDPLVSVIIPCYNYGAYLWEAIQSIQAQTLKSVEIIIVDDESTDPHTRNILNDIERNHPDLLVIRQSNRGVAAARNLGIRYAHGKYICCLDADDRLLPTYLEKAVMVLESDPSIGFVYGWVRMFGAEEGFWQVPPFDFFQVLNTRYNYVPTTAVFRRCAWQQVGGYDETFRQGYEDWEFWLRLTRKGWRGFLIPEVFMEYRQHTGTSLNKRAMQKHQMLIQQIRRKHPPFRLKWTALRWTCHYQWFRYRYDRPWHNLTADRFHPIPSPHTSSSTTDRNRRLLLVVNTWSEKAALPPPIHDWLHQQRHASTSTELFVVTGQTTKDLLRTGFTPPSANTFPGKIYHLLAYQGYESTFKPVDLLIRFIAIHRITHLILLDNSPFLTGVPHLREHFPHLPIAVVASPHPSQNKELAAIVPWLSLILTPNPETATHLHENLDIPPDKIQQLTPATLQYLLTLASGCARERLVDEPPEPQDTGVQVGYSVR